MANGHPHPHFHHPHHLPPTPAAHPSFAAPPVPGTPSAAGPAATPSPAMATALVRSGPAAPPSAVAPLPTSQLPALQKLAQANEQTWLLIGAVAEQMNDLDRALSAYEHAIRHNPHSIAGLTQIAGIARARENYPTAIEYFQRVLSLQRENGDVWSALGHCFLMQDDLQNAYSAYQQALYYLPNPKLQDPKLWYGIGILYDRYGSLEHAEEAFSSVLRMDKDFDKADEIFFRLGIIYKQQQKYEESLKCFDRIHRNPPTPLTNIDIWFQIGHVYEQMKDYNAAKDAYERVLKDSPNHAKVLQQLGWLYHQAGASFANQETAIMLITKSLESGNDAQSWYLLGRAYMAGQKYQKAYESYQQAVYRDGRNPTFWCSIGVLYYNINQFRDALDAYSRAIRINPYISEVWFDLGSLYESCNNQISDAIDAYARAAELDPGNPHITQRLNLLRNVQANGGTLPAAPGPQDIHPTAYAGNGPFNPMHGGSANVGPPPPLTGGVAGAIGGAPGQPRPPRPDSRGPDGGPIRELPALALNAPNGRPTSPPFRARRLYSLMSVLAVALATSWPPWTWTALPLPRLYCSSILNPRAQTRIRPSFPLRLACLALLDLRFQRVSVVLAVLRLVVLPLARMPRARARAILRRHRATMATLAAKLPGIENGQDASVVIVKCGTASLTAKAEAAVNEGRARPSVSSGDSQPTGFF
ncbi:general transcriptional corepressor ssn6 [Ceratobasidium sp. AG-Ba]|nr:general transcriptional corepressor ssn6 [Ceratobasidium sp. AG-Ba]